MQCVYTSTKGIMAARKVCKHGRGQSALNPISVFEQLVMSHAYIKSKYHVTLCREHVLC
jgi:hypothetical protein